MIIGALGLSTVVAFFGLGLYSQTGQAPGLQNGKLMPCPEKPNCVSSESAPTNSHAVAAIELTPEMGGEPMLIIKQAVENLGGDVSTSDDNYLAATFTSDIFGFVDDVEFRIDNASKLIHVRSSSRVGYSDFGANRKRVEAIRAAIKELTTKAVASNEKPNHS